MIYDRASTTSSTTRSTGTLDRSSSTTYQPAATPTWRARETGSLRSSTTVTDPRVIDVTGAALPPRVRFPQPAGSSRATGGTSSTELRSRSLATELQRYSSTERAAALRRTAALAPAVRTAPVSRDDILSRYRGAANTADVRERQATSEDARTLRRAAAERPGLSDIRRGREDGSEASARADAEARRISNARADQQQSNLSRVEKARSNYLRSIAAGEDGDSGSGDSGSGDSGSGDSGSNDGHGDDHHDDDHHHHYDDCYWDYYGSWYWGWGFYGWSWYGTSYCWGWYWNSYWYYGGYWNRGRYPSYYWYGPWLPASYSVPYAGYYNEPEVIYIEQEPDVIIVETAPAGEVVVETSPAAPAAPGVVPAPAQGDQLNRAADYYLNLGDRSFRDGRYADAVHFYAKAVEFAPEEGILYLILSDALLATGDFHYAAYALRRALELDAALATSVVDKHAFYADPTEFDRQVAVLETYLQDHPGDDDARLVLAANYLFGARPAAAVDLLEAPASTGIVNSQAGRLILEASRAVQYGTPGATKIEDQ